MVASTGSDEQIVIFDTETGIKVRRRACLLCHAGQAYLCACAIAYLECTCTH